jgi:hypothetical protein
VIAFGTEVPGVTARTVRCVPRIIGIRDRRCAVAAVTISTRCLAASVVARIVPAGVTVGTLVTPAVRGMTGIALHITTGVKMPGCWLRCCAAAGYMAIQAASGGAGVMNPRATDESRGGMTVGAIQ